MNAVMFAKTNIRPGQLLRDLCQVPGMFGKKAPHKGFKNPGENLTGRISYVQNRRYYDRFIFKDGIVFSEGLK